jgi:orotate phosphoribosyltransferase
VAGRRVLLVDDAVSSGTALEAFADELQAEGAILVGAFTLVDMRDVADSVSPTAATLPIESVGTYLEVLDAATELGVLDPAVHRLAVDALVNHWTNDDPRWALLDSGHRAA